MIEFLRVHPGWAWPLGSLVMAGLFWLALRVGARWADRTEPADDWDDEQEALAEWAEDMGSLDYGPAAFDDLGPEEQADQLIHEWHDDPAEVTQPWSLLDEWWSDLDGLERECELLHMSTREQDRAWAELIEETRALCPLAA